MRLVVQRVRRAWVSVQQERVAEIDSGVLVLLGIAQGDTASSARHLAGKVSRLRIFEDEQGLMNLSLSDKRYPALVVSQFTLLGDCRKGNRPGFTAAAPPELAEPLYETFVAELRALGHVVATGQFRTHMVVGLENDGPVTLILDHHE